MYLCEPFNFCGYYFSLTKNLNFVKPVEQFLLYYNHDSMKTFQSYRKRNY